MQKASTPKKNRNQDFFERSTSTLLLDERIIKYIYYMNKVISIMASVDGAKYKEVILYFANKIRNDTLGKVKLMKLLYYLDFDFFEKYHRSVTGDIYLRMPLGPVPKNAEFILKKMQEEGLIKIEKRKMPEIGFNDMQLIIPLRMQTTQKLSKEEIQMLDEIACKWEKLTGREMTNASHGEAPWIATEPDKEIDYNLTFYRNNYNEMKDM